MNLKDIYDYKNLIMEKLCSDAEIVRLLTDSTTNKLPRRNLAYSQIFPFEFVPETIDNAQTIICYDVDIPIVENKTFVNPVIYFWVFTHKSLLRLPKGEGIRLDKISMRLDELFNGSREVGLGELNLRSVLRFTPILDYNGRILTYETKEFNRTGMKPTPTNRKQ